MVNWEKLQNFQEIRILKILVTNRLVHIEDAPVGMHRSTNRLVRRRNQPDEPH